MDEFRKVHPNGDTYCSKCKEDRQTKFRKSNPEKVKEYSRISSRKQRYGVSSTQYKELLERSKNVCMICGEPPKTRNLHIDHCHATGEVRGLLCHGCNTALGLFKENIEIMEKAMNYLSEAGMKKKAKKK